MLHLLTDAPKEASKIEMVLHTRCSIPRLIIHLDLSNTFNHDSACDSVFYSIERFIQSKKLRHLLSTKYIHCIKSLCLVIKPNSESREFRRLRG